MPKMEIQIHPLAVKRLRGGHVDTQTKDRGTGRTDAIILHGIVELQRRGYMDDSGVCIKDHYAGTQANLVNFGARAVDIINALGYAQHIGVTVELADGNVVLWWRNV